MKYQQLIPCLYTNIITVISISGLSFEHWYKGKSATFVHEAAGTPCCGFCL
jgi:hypothetical protein